MALVVVALALHPLANAYINLALIQMFLVVATLIHIDLQLFHAVATCQKLFHATLSSLDQDISFETIAELFPNLSNYIIQSALDSYEDINQMIDAPSQQTIVYIGNNNNNLRKDLK